MTIQPKLRVNTPGDRFEQEADRLADRVMRMPAPQAPTFQAQASPGNTPAIASETATRIQALRGGGQALPAGERQFFGRRMGADFSYVRVHTGPSADELAAAVQAKAFTVGRDVVFGSGQYAPGTAAGRHLLAHELTHVLQQRTGPTLQRQVGVGNDLTSPRFRGDPVLEEVLDGKRYLHFGHFGSAVIKLQLALIDAAFIDEEFGEAIDLPRFGVDGDFRAETKKAVKAFQRRKGLTGKDVDGIVGPITMGLLDEHFPPVAGSPRNSPAPVPATKKTVTVNVTQLFGSTKSILNAFRVANVLFAQANLEVRLGTYRRLDKHRSEALIGDDHTLEEGLFEGMLSPEEAALFAVNQKQGEVSAYFVPEIKEEIGGESTIAYSRRPTRSPVVGFVVSNIADDKTFSHELGHILLDDGKSGEHVTDDVNALMDPAALGTQLSAGEIAILRSSSFAREQ